MWRSAACDPSWRGGKPEAAKKKDDGAGLGNDMERRNVTREGNLRNVSHEEKGARKSSIRGEKESNKAAGKGVGRRTGARSEGYTGLHKP